MAKILLFGYYGFGNFGDELLITSIKEHLTGHDLTVVSENPKETENLHRLEAISRKQFWLSSSSFDVFLLGGGSLLQNATSNRSLFYYLAAINRAQRQGLDVYLMAQGLGPFKKTIFQPCVSHGIMGLRGIPLTVRDKQSQKIAIEYGLKADLVADLTLTYEHYPQRASLNSTKKIIGIAPKKGFHIGSEEWLKKLVDINSQIRLFAFHRQDHELCLELEGRLPNAVTIKMEKPSDLKYFADLNFLWGMRLHSLVIAAAIGIPALGISYDPKVASFCEEVGFKWHLPQTMPKEEWISSGAKTYELIERSKKAWQLFADTTESKQGTSSTPGHTC